MTQDKPIPFWQKLTASGCYLFLAAAFVIFHARIGADFWPFDESRVAPNILASIIQAALVFPIGVLLWPPTRRRIHRLLDKKFDRIHARLDGHDSRHGEHAESLRLLHEKLDQLLERNDGGKV